ncbi:MAG: flagellar biosynthesis anti-sigma factor FlgM [Magnetococcales bacterium]|nr:flagellar biosynthesis anti-sigma factor FlgM [Magnetococcales bacterium]
MKIKGMSTGKLGRITRGRVSNAKSGAKGAKGARGRRTGGARQDDVAVSEGARIIGGASDAIHAAPELRMERIEPIREALAAGRYSVASLDVADKILRQVLMDRKRPV